MKDNILNDVYLGEEYAYLRPYICRGNPYDAKVFFDWYKSSDTNIF